MKFENNKSGNGGVLTLNNEIKEVGRLTYTIFPEDHKLIISFVLVHPEFEGRGMGKFWWKKPSNLQEKITGKFILTVLMQDL
jgi:predicted GNAT family acetyltransferase